MSEWPWVLLFVLWLPFVIAGAQIGAQRGDDALSGALLGLFFGPIGLVIAFYLGDEASREARLIRLGERIRCPKCAALARPEASHCERCGQSIPLELEVSAVE